MTAGASERKRAAAGLRDRPGATDHAGVGCRLTVTADRNGARAKVQTAAPREPAQGEDGGDRCSRDLQLHVVDAAPPAEAPARLRRGILDVKMLAMVGRGRRIRHHRTSRGKVIRREAGARRLGEDRSAAGSALQRRHRDERNVAIAAKQIGRERIGLAVLHLAEVLHHGAIAVVAFDVRAVGRQPHVIGSAHVPVSDGVKISGIGPCRCQTCIPGSAGGRAVIPARCTIDVVGITEIGRTPVPVFKARIPDGGDGGLHCRCRELNRAGVAGVAVERG